MMCCLKDACRVGDVYRRIHRCVQNQQRLSKGAYPLPLVVLGQILDEAAANAERPPTQVHPSLALSHYGWQVSGKQVSDVIDIEGCSDGDHRRH